MDSTATQRATPPEVMSEITGRSRCRPARGPAAPRSRSSKGRARGADGLRRLVTLAGQEDDVPGPGERQGPVDGRPAVHLDDHLAPAVHAGPHLVDDGRRVLGAGVVRGEHDHLGHAGGHRPHLGALAPVAVAAATEQADHPSAVGHVTSRGDGPLQPGRGVGIVDHHGEGRPARTTSMRPGTGWAAPSPSATRSSSTPRRVATVAATRALSTLKAPLNGSVTGRPRQRKDDQPMPRRIPDASARRTAVTGRPRTPRPGGGPRGRRRR